MKKPLIIEFKGTKISIIILVCIILVGVSVILFFSENEKDRLVIERDYYKDAFLGVCDTMNSESNLINLIERHTPSDENYLEQLNCEGYILE